jgi:hypothetical protein
VSVTHLVTLTGAAYSEPKAQHKLPNFFSCWLLGRSSDRPFLFKLMWCIVPASLTVASRA